MKTGRFRFAVALFGFLLLSNGANAAAPEDTDSLQLAQHLVDLQVGGDDVKKKTSDAYIAMFTPLVMRDNPGQQQAVDKIMEQTIPPVMASGLDDTKRQTAEIYAQNFTPDELRAIIAFQESPVGVKYRKFGVDSSQKIMIMGKATGMAKAQEAIHALVAQLKANNLHVPKELDH